MSLKTVFNLKNGKYLGKTLGTKFKLSITIHVLEYISNNN